MSYNFSQSIKKTTRGRRLFTAALVLGSALGTVNQAVAQRVTPPPTPIGITPEAGNSAFLVGHAFGTQGYICLPTAPGASTAAWNSNNARPEATLFTKVFGQDVQIITHFLSPDTHPNENAPNPLPFGNATWQSSFDSSRVWAKAINTPVVAGTDPESCPNSGSIPCLLLESVGNKKGPAGGRLLADVTFVQRLNTYGGAAPTTACSAGQTQLQPYTADYYFYHAAE